MSVWDKSSFLDLAGSGITDATTPEQAYGITSPSAYAGTLTIGLVLPRLADPTSLLSGPYAQREAVLNGLSRAQVGAMFGASQAQYDGLVTYLRSVAGASLATDTLVSSAQSRTLWVKVDSQAFQTLFGTPLRTSSLGFAYWDGTLAPNANISFLAGLWSLGGVGQVTPTVQDSTGVALPDGPQGVANTAGGGYDTGNTRAPHTFLYPNQIAAEYHFPLQATGATALATPAIGLIEPTYGSAVAPGNDPNDLLQAYRRSAGVTGTGIITEGTVEGPIFVPTGSDERSLDVGVVAAAAPNSNIVTFGGSNGSTYATIEEAVWADGPKIGQLSTSFGFNARPAAGSPFAAALNELYTDAALNNITMLTPAGDGGSSNEIGTGVPQILGGVDSPFNLVVGGTSTSNQAQVAAAGAATTDGGPNINAGVAALLAQAINGDPAALQTLVSGGLLHMPTAATNIPALLQTAWNQYTFDADANTLNNSYVQNAATGGGVDPDMPEPLYQVDAGIDTRILQQNSGVTPSATAARGIPDVSALAGGNQSYYVPKPDMTGIQGNGGTSAATPLWAALLAQVQAVFANQGLPALGTVNDLIYQAAAIAPGAFDDVQFGSNTSSFIVGGDATVNAAGKTEGQTEAITPTGLGYTAGPGYDLVSGLGTPDGILLARAMVQIAQSQIHGPAVPAVTDGTGTTSQADQVLILQPTLSTGFSGSIAVGSSFFTPAGDGSGLGWSARIAQKTLQSFFGPVLAKAIAGQAQASSTQVSVTSGEALPVSIGGVSAQALAAADTSAFGFVSYATGTQAVTLARPLAVAETFDGRDDTTAIVRMRQESADRLGLSFYRVDDLLGRVDGIAPGQAGYEAAAGTRIYRTANGSIGLTGPGQAGFQQAGITGVDNGDIIAFRLQDFTTGTASWGMAGQNGGTNDLWSYGADTWGFDDSSDGAFDSLVFQLDFTSNGGSGLLAFDAAPACFVAGTLIATSQGECPVERLAVGDLVATAGGAFRPVRWIGRRSYAGRFLKSHPALHPVRLRAGSLGSGLPRRDLLVSPTHAMLLAGVLVPARCLLDGISIVPEAGLAAVEYVHVELDSHDVLLAEGAPSESFVDDDSRGVFQNAAEWDRLHPGRKRVPAVFCAPRVESGAELQAIRRRLNEVTGQLARAA